MTVGRGYTVAAWMQFFGMTTIDESPSYHPPPYDVVNGDGDKISYFNKVLDKFVDHYLMPSPNTTEFNDPTTDRVREYSLCFLKLFFILSDFKEAVRTGNGDRLASLYKVLLKHFKSVQVTIPMLLRCSLAFCRIRFFSPSHKLVKPGGLQRPIPKEELTTTWR